jgi:hypothetical protein
MTSGRLSDLLMQLADASAPRTEAMIQADIRQFLLTAPLNLEPEDLQDLVLESPLGDRRRIDIEMGATVIEVKRDLKKGKVRAEAIEQLHGYVEKRIEQTGQRYVGLLTDGVTWECYHTRAGALELVTAMAVSPVSPDLDSFLVWLEGVLATTKAIAPTALEIYSRLGAQSSSHSLDKSSLRALYSENKDLPSVALKRKLWARLLTSALGTQFEDDDDLFVEHTLLVNSAEIIAHALLGLPVEVLGPASLLSGSKFDESGIHGVVERDFFDWVLEVKHGDAFVRSMAKRLARFDWSQVQQDVLKVLYESVIGQDTRKKLGEYYTPDWLAYRMVQDVVKSPLTDRVLDPACGSGTFLFHAVRLFIDSAQKAGMALANILSDLTHHVIGLELHPVAVTLARVTYLLAIGRANLTNPDRGPIQVPVYLGDSIQWREQQTDLLNSDDITILADDNRELFSTELRFPESLLENAGGFDELVQELADRAAARKPSSTVPSLNATFQRLAIPSKYHETIRSTFKIMCGLHDQGRDHIWGYYVRNLARPMWLSRPANRVDVIIGNPPWLAFRHMTRDMQDSFSRMCKSRGLWQGATVATHQDLSALFVVRAAQLYLKEGGRFALVMPNAAVDREQYSGFRAGSFPDSAEPLNLSFGSSWDLRRLRPHFFPRGASVVFGARQRHAAPMPQSIEIWSGRLPSANASWLAAAGTIRRETGSAQIVTGTAYSPYRDRFSQGATFSPRVLFMVDRQAAGPLGVPVGRVGVKSSRNANEKKPWSELESIEGIVETEFVRPLYNGENLLPFRMTSPDDVVVPWESSGGLLSGSHDRLELYPGLADWWKRAERIWVENRSSDRLELVERLNYRRELIKQFPIGSLRIVYNKSGMHLAAALITDNRAVINSGLYWATARSVREGCYLCAILNSPVTTDLVRPYMSYGKDERDIHKHVWEMPIEEFDETKASHARLAMLGERATTLANETVITSGLHFSAQRRQIRKAIAAADLAEEIDQLVFESLS